jgi:hypothetical protein
MKRGLMKSHHTFARTRKPVRFGAAAITAAVLVACLSGCNNPPEGYRWSSRRDDVIKDNFTNAILYGEAEVRRLTEQEVNYKRPQLSIYSNAAAPKAATAALSLKDLSDHAQASVVNAEATKPSQAAQLRENLAKGLANKARATEGLADPFRFDRTLIATVIKGTDAEPGDRLIWTRIFVQPLGFSFANYSITASDLQTDKIASLEDTTTQKISGTFGVSSPIPVKPTISVTPDLEHTSKADADISQQYQNLGVDIQPGFVRIYRESERGLDVSGNTLLSLTLIADQKMASEELVLIGSNPHLFDGAAALSPAKASLDVQPQQPLLHCPLRARVRMQYEKRDILSGRASYDEGKQGVVLVKDASDFDTNNRPGSLATIMTADEVSPAIWQIVTKIDTKDGNTEVADPAGQQDIQAGVQGGNPRPLLFTDFGTATQLAHWIRETGAKRIGKNLVLTNTTIKGKSVSLVVKKRWQDPKLSSTSQLDDEAIVADCIKNGSDGPSNMTKANTNPS